MKLHPGCFLRNIDNEYKSKVVLDILTSKSNTIIVVYKFWNQVGDKERATTLDSLLKNHMIK